MAGNVIYEVIGILDWIYRYDGTFEIEDLLKYTNVKPDAENKAACVRFLEHNNLAYNLSFGISQYWISRRSVFEGKIVAVTPTEFELKQGILIPGSRFAPYVTNVLEQHMISIIYDKEELYPELVSLPLKEIREYYCLYSEEKLFEELTRVCTSNYIDYETYENEEERYYIPAFKIKKFYQKHSFSSNDQVILKIESYMYKDVELCGISSRSIPESYKKDWEKKFTKLLNVNLASKPAENNTIVDVLSHTLYLLDAVSTQEYLIPLQEYLQEHKMLDDITIGVNNIVWVKDAIPVAPKFWYPFTADFRYILQRANKDEVFFSTLYLPITDPVIEVFVYQFLEENYIKVNEEPKVYKEICIKRFRDEFFSFEKYKECYKKINSIFSRKYDRYVKKYNPFVKKEEMDVAFGMFALFRRLYRALVHLQKLNVAPCDIAYDTSIIVNQMSEDMVEAMHDIHELLEGKIQEDVKKFKSGLIDLTEKFSLIVEGLEQFVLFNFGKQ